MNLEEILNVFRARTSERYYDAAVALAKQANTFTIADLAALTGAVANTGDKLLSTKRDAIKADVPSTGAPGSLSTLLCPVLLAAEGILVPKLSAAGSVAGGIDTMGLLDGYKTQLWGEQFDAVLVEVGYAHARPSERFCPADNVLIKVRKELDLMECAPLAAISLLSKKLAIPGTLAAFDFRVGATGNIGNTEKLAQEAASLFHEVAGQLGLKIAIRLTDNRYSPSSALGRFESLFLLVNVLKTKVLGTWDASHVNTCLELAADAVVLAKGGNFSEVVSKLRSHLTSGKAWEVFCRHIAAQGASQDAIEKCVTVANQRRNLVQSASKSGFWVPPDLDTVKSWIKRSNSAARGAEAKGEVGLHLVSEPFSQVVAGQPLVKVAIPIGCLEDITIPPELSGLISVTEPEHEPFRSYVHAQKPAGATHSA